jgi:hypothetical protein
MISRGLAAYHRDGNLDEPTKTEDDVRPARVATPLTARHTRKGYPKQPRAQLHAAPKKRDKIDAAIDAALGFTGKPVSEQDRKKIRDILEKVQGKESE